MFDNEENQRKYLSVHNKTLMWHVMHFVDWVLFKDLPNVEEEHILCRAQY